MTVTLVENSASALVSHDTLHSAGAQLSVSLAEATSTAATSAKNAGVPTPVGLWYNIKIGEPHLGSMASFDAIFNQVRDTEHTPLVASTAMVCEAKQAGRYAGAEPASDHSDLPPVDLILPARLVCNAHVEYKGNSSSLSRYMGPQPMAIVQIIDASGTPTVLQEAASRIIVNRTKTGVGPHVSIGAIPPSSGPNVGFMPRSFAALARVPLP